MNGYNISVKLGVPIIATMLWCAGLCIGVYGLLPKLEDPKFQFVLIAHSVYLLFVVESIVDFLNVSAKNQEQHYNSSVFIMFGVYTILFMCVVIATFFQCVWNDCCICSIMILVFMTLHKFVMAFFNNNQSIFLHVIKGQTLNSNI